MYFVKKNEDKRSSFLDDFNNFFTGGIFSKDMKTDIEENEKEYTVSVDVPGVDKKDINLSFEDGYLTVSVEQNTENEDKNKSYIRKERSSMSMTRSYYLEYGDENCIKAKLNDGVLKIQIGKVENKIEPKKSISIE